MWLNFMNTYNSPEMIRISEIHGIRRTRNGTVEIRWIGGTSYADEDFNSLRSRITRNDPAFKPCTGNDIPY